MKIAIYVPGLGDNHTYGQPTALLLWRLFGVKAIYFPLIWNDKESYDSKNERLLNKIDELINAGNDVSLVGVSAGASAALNAFSARPTVSSVICICGKINNPKTISRRVFEKNPAFERSLLQLETNLKKLSLAQRAKILSIHPIEDKVVPIKDTLIPGAHEMQINTRGHVFSIFYCVTFRCRTICKFITA